MATILQKESPVLRKIAKEVPVREIPSPRIQKLLSDMSRALAREDDGVALAAPQVGEGLRLFVVSRRIFEQEPDPELSEAFENDLVFINPVLLKKSREKEWVPEGCLSVRWLYGKAKRSVRATVKAYSAQGEEFTLEARGLLAQIFQHEIDHLNGILFIDHAVEIEDLPPDQPKKS